MNKKKGGRPIKALKKSCRAELRLTENEYQKLLAIEEATGLNRSHLFIARVIEQQDFLITKDVIAELAKVGEEVGRVGNNINQLARHANTIIKRADLPPQIVEAFNVSLATYTSLERDIYTILRQMYQVMKKRHGS